jgi:phosphonate degradation associated HDIG domain protein
MTIADELISIYAERGTAAYFGEAVSMTQHSLQAAHFARAANASDALVVAALLHDVGHLIDSVPQDIGEWTTDAAHELTGSRWLAARFGPEVWQPVRLHVPAKRYLCATDPAYFGKLSNASVLTLKLQGGAMSGAEVTAFEAQAYRREAVLVRQWDDQGKIAGLPTPDFISYRALIDRLAAAAPPRRNL